ncbi:MAG TPA: nucleotidyl transferase AbiEii/AbiGii toxin family protein [Gemmataceae bacterium]|jgi:predicted nucleotidyltransferase component of viral defense system
MFGDGSLTFREFMMREPLPLATIHDAVLEFLRGRDDAVLYGAQAVNAYVEESRMTQDVDIASPRAEELAEELREFLNKRFHIAVRVRNIREGLGYRIYQVQKPKNRHLIDVRPVESLPPSERVNEVLVVSPAELMAEKVLSMVQRTDPAKSLIDQADLIRLLRTFPYLKTVEGAVVERLQAAGASAEVMEAWEKLVAQDIKPMDEADKFGG